MYDYIKRILKEVEEKEDDAEAKDAQATKLRDITKAVLDPAASHAKKRARKTVDDFGSGSDQSSKISAVTDRSAGANSFERWLMERLKT